MMNTIMTSFKKPLPFIVAVICVIAFFCANFFPEKTESYLNAKKKHYEARSERQNALEEVKLLTKGTTEYKNYLLAKSKADLAWKKYQDVKKADRVFGFTNIQQFLGQLGWVFGLFFYSVFNLFRSYTSSTNDKGYQILHVVLNGISIYYMFWLFQPFQDLSLIYYIVFSILFSVLISYSIHLMVKYNMSDIGKLQSIIRECFDFILIEVKENKMIKEDKKSHYDDKSVELVKNALDNE